jgi:hypothetical protein
MRKFGVIVMLLGTQLLLTPYFIQLEASAVLLFVAISFLK